VITFLAGTGSVVLIFLAGAELDPGVFREKWKESSRSVSSDSPSVPRGDGGRALCAGLGLAGSWLSGVALSTTSVAVVYAVMLELGFNELSMARRFWRPVSSMTWARDCPGPHLFAFYAADGGLPGWRHWPCSRRFRLRLPGCPSVTAGAFPNWRPSTFCSCCSPWEGWPPGPAARPCCPPTSSGWCWPGLWAKDHFLIRRLRTLTFGLLTPFYFIRAGSFVSVAALIAGPTCLRRFVFRQDVSKLTGLSAHRAGVWVQRPRRYLLLADDVHRLDLRPPSSALFGLNHGHHRSEPVFPPGGDSHCERRNSDRSSERSLHAAPLIAGDGRRVEGIRYGRAGRRPGIMISQEVPC